MVATNLDQIPVGLVGLVGYFSTPTREKNKLNMYKIQIGRNEVNTSFSIYWNVYVDTKKIILKDTIEAYTENTGKCEDTSLINPSEGTFKKITYLKGKGIISFEDCEGKLWRLKE